MCRIRAIAAVLTVGRMSTMKIASFGAAAAAALAASLVVDLPNVATVLDHVTAALGPWTYALVGALVFMETVAFVGLLAFGEVTLIVGGAAAANGDVALVPILALVWICGILGDLTGYALGRRYGWSLIRRVGPRLGLGESRQRRIDDKLVRWGGKALVAGRFVGPVRVFAAFAAGTSGMSCRRLLRLSALGVGLWAPTLLLASYVFADAIGSYLQYAGNVIIGLMAAAAAVYVVRRRRRPAMAAR
jgi:undecaprenyl-diphosphatase